MSRKVYLEDIPLDEAWRRFSEALKAIGRWQPIEGEDIPVPEALGRVTARPIWAHVSSPAYHASAMDGYAVRAEETNTANDTHPLQLELGMQAQVVDTGDPLPGWADAVIMIENVQPIGTAPNGATHIEIRAPIAPWTAVRPLGEDMVATELVLPANHVLRPVDLGALAGSGHATVNVRRKPRVAVIPTGTELITVEQAAQSGVKSGDIIEYNSIVLAAEVEQWGGIATRYPIVIDNFDAIKTVVQDAASQHDLVLINAGSSAGSEDFTARVVQELGTLLVHGIAVRPGHPVILGMVVKQDAGGNPTGALRGMQDASAPASHSTFRIPHSAIPIIGVPGYPVSAALTGEIFVEPLLAKWLGLPGHQKPMLRGHITRKLLSPMGEDEWVRVTAGKVGDRIVAAPLSRGAGVITSLVRADGIVRIPRFSEGVDTGEEVTIELYTDPAEIDRTIVHIGSHDLTLDLLAQHLAEVTSDSPIPDRSAQRRFVSAHAGSLGGLIALRRGEAHLAGSHLLDPETGEYNFAYIKQYVPNVPVVVVTLLRREQGLIVAQGNPKSIASLKDLARSDVRFVNRQRGAGTRVLLDYRLKELGIAAEAVHGYQREEYTHLAVAAAVQSGVADCGLGVRAAARALDLDFVSVEWERYDLVIPQQFYESELLQPLLTLIRGESFRKVVGELEGYDSSGMGNVARGA